jgi:hypothetical protein
VSNGAAPLVLEVLRRARHNHSLPENQRTFQKQKSFGYA